MYMYTYFSYYLSFKDIIKMFCYVTYLKNMFCKIFRSLKPMDSFGTCMAKMKIYIFFLLMQNFIELYELLMPC